MIRYLSLVLFFSSFLSSCNNVQLGVGSINQSQIYSSGPTTADGVAIATIRIRLMDSSGEVLTGVTPTFEATDTGSTNTYGSCSVTNFSGESTCTLSSRKAELKTLHITSPISKSGGSVVFVSGAPHGNNSQISGTTNVLANGSDTSLVTIILKDSSGNPIPGQTPTFEATNFDNKNTYGNCSISNSYGESKCTLASSEGETKVLTITSPIRKTGQSVVFTEIDYCVGNANTNLPFAFGDGTQSNPYGICTAAQLNNIGTDPTYIQAHFKLFKNIDLSSYTSNSFNRIGSVSNPFTGKFNGNRKSISHFTYSDAAADYVGLFGQVEGAGLVKNLNLIDAHVTGKTFVGALAGEVKGNVDNCFASGIVIGSDRVGGLIGRFWETDTTTTVKNSRAEVDVSGTNGFVGGLIGWVRGKIEGSSAKGTVTTTSSVDRAGGLAGVGDLAEFVKCSSESTVTGRNYIGGLVGYVVGSVLESKTKSTVNCFSYCGGLVGTISTNGLTGKISKSFAEVTVNSGSMAVGGITGYVGTGFSVDNSYAVVTINTTSTFQAGVVGYTIGPVTNSYAIPIITGAATSRAGVTVVGAGGSVANSFWDKEMDPSIPDSAGSKTTLEMKDPQTFISAGWDSSIWNLQSGSYPTLKAFD